MFKVWLSVCTSIIFLAVAGGVVGRAPGGATEAPAGDPRPGYAGDAACVHCHQSEATTYAGTAHRKASQPANAETILGDFKPGKNLLRIAGEGAGQIGDQAMPTLRFAMERKADQFSETALTGWGTELHRRSERIAVVTGAGVRGQTFLYWQGDRLFELPVSYWSDGRRWINSPGYIDGTADFARPVNPGCLECHASYIKATSQEATTNSYVKESLVTGIGCETCHGAGAEHVANCQAAPSDKEKATADPCKQSGKAILNPATFSRDRQVDACAVCHSGTARTALQPAFTFVPGKPLSEFFSPIAGPAADHPDVHGNQVGLLQRSKCLLKSEGMSCSTCHNVHAPERPPASYSEKCLTCHTWQSCGVSKTRGIAIRKNCIDCHMPVEATNLIVSETAGQTVRARMRNHWIKVYPSTMTPRQTGL